MPSIVRIASVLLLWLLLSTSLAAAQTSPAWQQRVRYEMDIHLDAEQHRMRGRSRIVYYNHSPDTLRHVFFFTCTSTPFTRSP